LSLRVGGDGVVLAANALHVFRFIRFFQTNDLMEFICVTVNKNVVMILPFLVAFEG
jgi:hypothetical protein